MNAALVFHCNPDRIDSARRAFREVGVQVIPFRSDFKGLRTWFLEEQHVMSLKDVAQLHR